MKINIKGFKCFADESFDLNKMTVFTGANGAGKSTVIQMLLLLRQAIEKSALFNQTTKEYDINSWRAADVLLNGDYCLNLGDYDDIINENSEGNTEFTIDGIKFQVENSLQEGVVLINPTDESKAELPEPLKSLEFYYLNAERLGPRYHYEYNYHKFNNSGFYGELSAKVLSQNEFTNIETKKKFLNDGPERFKIQLDRWLDYICPNISVSVEPLGKFMGQVKLRNHNNSVSSIAPNIGFGISYALPIIIDGLLAKPNRMLIVENPEAHLHPKAQSNLGFFLGQMAAAGVYVIIETHSEHVVNGIRRASLSNLGLLPEQVNIYFFENEKGKVEHRKIGIDSEGNLTDFPIDFFDQVRQDMLELIKLAGG